MFCQTYVGFFLASGYSNALTTLGCCDGLPHVQQLTTAEISSIKIFEASGPQLQPWHPHTSAEAVGRLHCLPFPVPACSWYPRDHGATLRYLSPSTKAFSSGFRTFSACVSCHWRWSIQMTNDDCFRFPICKDLLSK